MPKENSEMELIHRENRIKITELIEDILNAEVPPSLDEMCKVAKEMKIYGCENKNNTIVFSLVLSVILKGIAKGDLNLLEFVLNLQNGMINQGKPNDINFARLVSAIQDLKG